MPPPDRYVIPFKELGIDDVPIVGGKNASLGEMLTHLSDLGVRVPDGFAITADAFRLHLSEAGITDWINETLDKLDTTDTSALSKAAGDIRERVCSASLPAPVLSQIMDAYVGLSSGEGKTDSAEGNDVAVRSSATAEDLPTASFAGQQETYLNVKGKQALDKAVRACMGSLYTDRAIVYRVENSFDHRAVALSVGVQRMVRSDAEPGGCAGTMFTLDTESGSRSVVVIDASWGLGEAVVQGRVSPDEYWIHKQTAKEGFRSIIRKDVGEKALKLVYAISEDPNTSRVREVEVPVTDRQRFVLTDDEAIVLAKWAMIIEEHYTRQSGSIDESVPMDIEWAKDGRTNTLFVLQARPETVHSQQDTVSSLEIFSLKEKPVPILTGKAVGSRIGSGVVRIVRGTEDLPGFQQGDVLVAEMTDPDWEPVLRKASAVVTDRGGRTCHAAIVSREMDLPCVVGTSTGTSTLRDGQEVTISCAQGDVGNVYEGRVPYEHEHVQPGSIPESRVPLMLNLADPGHAFRLSRLPTAGVGLLRIEFLVSNWIGVHPMALVHAESVNDPEMLAEIQSRAAFYPSLSDFFVERLASGIAQIAAAFHPRPVIVRFSDFKTNEYAKLLGGEAFEPQEDNPMLGFRGASRYYDNKYRDGFALECAAIRRVTKDMGLTNTIVMVPFCRTLDEGQRVLSEMERHDLRRGENGMQVYVMCEIPNNVVLASEFSELFDGFSIGSNDLTQLTLGVDRDSDLLSHVFNEQDPGVKRLIESVVQNAHAKGRKVGICGEAPSNYPDFAGWLASIGIDSISLNADSLPKVAERLAKAKLDATASSTSGTTGAAL